jgi:SpoVK/Ycf46/Vps4 family AAA+-type ATPase
MIRAYSAHSDEGFKTSVEELARYEDKKGNIALALDIREAIRPAYDFAEEDNEISSGLDELIDIDGVPVIMMNPEEHIEDIILGDDVRGNIEQIIGQWKNRRKLGNIGPASRILMTGPPGCGKTMTAKAISHELGLPLAYVRLDDLISMYLGQTGSNIGRIFDLASKRRCILFMDEFDSIARDRSSDDIGESKRILTSILQNMDLIGNRVMIIAATNMPQDLDPAIVRRFDVRLDFHMPDENNRRDAIGHVIGKYIPWYKPNMDLLVKLTKGSSYAEIESFILALARYMLMNELRDIEDGVVIRIRFGWNELDFTTLHSMGFTYREMEELTRVSRTTIEYRIKKGR